LPHQLRHTFATEMIRLGVSLPAVMQLLGHKDIRALSENPTEGPF
jgi:integrase/recombinase XerD